jgi:hypothetical protein
MKKLSLTLAALVLGALCTHAASADTFSFSFTGSQFDGSGTLVATSLGDNQFKLTAASGSIDGSSSISLIGVNGFQSNDNLLYSPGFYDSNIIYGTQGPFNFDNAGASFELLGSQGQDLGDVNLFQDANGFLDLHYYEAAYLDPTGRGDDITETLTTLSVTNTTPSAVPEPGTLALFSTGMLGLAGLIRRKLAV